MLVFMFQAMFGAPGTYIHAQFTIFLCKTTIGRHEFYSRQAGINAKGTTHGAIVMAFFPGHFGKAVLAGYQALLASLYTVFIGGFHDLVLVKNKRKQPKMLALKLYRRTHKRKAGLAPGLYRPRAGFRHPAAGTATLQAD